MLAYVAWYYYILLSRSLQTPVSIPWRLLFPVLHRGSRPQAVARRRWPHTPGTPATLPVSVSHTPVHPESRHMTPTHSTPNESCFLTRWKHLAPVLTLCQLFPQPPTPLRGETSLPPNRHTFQPLSTPRSKSGRELVQKEQEPRALLTVLEFPSCWAASFHYPAHPVPPAARAGQHVTNHAWVT